MMTFDALLAHLGLTPRPSQADFAAAIGNALSLGAPVAVAAQASTGVGKTLALAHAALNAAQAGKRVIWSTHTVLLRAQVMETLSKATAALGAEARFGTPVERRGRADYPSASRIRRMRHALADRGAERDTLAQLDTLADWEGTFAEFIATHGDLLLPQSLLCLTAASPDEEQALYIEQRDRASAARLVVQTHALTLIEARFGRLDADLVILDEADTIPSVAAGAVELRITLDDLADLAERVGADVETPLALLHDRAKEAPLVWRDGAIAEAAKTIRAELSSRADEVAPELAQAIADVAEDLARFVTIEAPKTGAAIVTTITALPVLAVSSVDAAAWLGHALRERQTVLVSATLGQHEEDGLVAACRRFGFTTVRKVNVSPEMFGEIRFRLADRSVAPPFTDEEPEPHFFDYGATIVERARQTGRTLVLCASYGDVEELAKRLAGTPLLQRRGEPLPSLVERFRETERAVLVTPAAWAGLDLPHLVDNVVILRLPFGRPDPLRHAVLTEALVRRGRGADDARNILFAEQRADMLRRLTQGMGRGIRAADDRCTVWIADPRFPLPVSAVADLRRRLTQGHAQGWTDLVLAIPRRFRTPSGRSAFDRATIERKEPKEAAA